MDGITFDSLGYSKELIEAGFTQQQAEALARSMLKLDQVCKAEQAKFEAERHNTLATKADIMAIKEIMATKADIEAVKAELTIKMKDAEMRLLKWQLGIGFALVVIMAKGFGWLGF